MVSERETYKKQGYLIYPQQVIPQKQLEEAITHLYKVMEGYYETGISPTRISDLDSQRSTIKIDNVHFADYAIRSLVSHPAIANAVLEATQAKKIQVWATQFFYKPPNSGDEGNIGWHADQSYHDFWKGTLHNVWLALSPITADNAPLIYIEGSHQWGNIGERKGFDRKDMAMQQAEFDITPYGQWKEVPVIISAGGFSMHDGWLLHGSKANRSEKPRMSIAIHLCTEQNSFVEGQEDFGFREFVADTVKNPIIYEQ